MCAVYKEKALTEKALLKHLDGKADGKKVAKVEKKVVVSEAERNNAISTLSMSVKIDS